MSSRRSLHEQLTDLGSRPAPAPRPEFVEALLDRLLNDEVTDDLTVAPVVALDSRRRLVAKFAWVASVAAALVIAVAAVSLVSGGTSGQEGTALALTAAPGVADGVQVTVDDNGYMARLPDEQASGRLEFVCTDDGHFKSASGEQYVCVRDQAVTVVVRDKSIVAVEGLTPVATAEPPDVIGLDFDEGVTGTTPSGTWRWERADPERFGRYVLLRREGADPVYRGAGTSVVAELRDIDAVSHLDNALPVGSWTYQLLVVDDTDEVTALSDLVTVNAAPS